MSNSSYWESRIERALEENRKKELKEVEKELARIYKQQGMEIKSEIYAVFEKIDSGDFIVNDLYRNNRYWELIAHINDELRDLGYAEIEMTEDFLIKVYEVSQELVEDGVPEGMVNTSFLNTSVIDARQVVNQAWAADGLTLSDRVWKNKKLVLNALEKGMQTMVVQGKSPWAIACEMEKIYGMDINKAYRLARTESAHIKNKASCDKYKAMGFTHGKYLGKNCCPECQKHNGQIYTLDELETMIPMHPNCTCSYTLERMR